MAYNPYNFTWTDQAPLFQYAPAPRDTIASAGWNSSFTGSDPSKYSGETFPIGTSSHTTTNTQATVSVDWTGTAIYLQGTSSNGASGYGITIDGAGVTPVYGNGFLHTVTGLNYGSHSLVLSVKSGTVGINGTTITAGVGPSGSDVTVRTTTFTGSSLQTPPEVTFGSQSSWFAQLGYDSGSYPRIGTNTPGATVSFAFSGASAFVVYGSTNVNHDTYQVTMSGTDGTNKVSSFNGLTQYINFNQILYLTTGLDQNQNYTIIIQNTASTTNQYFDIGSYSIYTSTGSGSHKTGRISLGAIIGISVGAVALVIAGIILFWIMRRRAKRNSIEKSHNAGLWDNMTHEVTPFDPYNAIGSQSPPLTSSAYPPSEMGSTMYGIQRPPAAPLGMHRPSSSYDGPQSQSSSSYLTDTKQILVSNNQEELPALVHASDAGPALPPMYDPLWSSSRQPGSSTGPSQLTSMGYRNEKTTLAPPPS